MKIAELVKDIAYNLVQGTLDAEVESVVYDSRKVEKNSLFVCIAGANVDGHDFAQEVAEKGASVLLVEKDVSISDQTVTIIKVADTHYAFGFVCAAWFGYPAKQLKTIGITGTKGKTTTTYLVKSILEKAGHKTGLIGTIEAIIGEEHIPAANTTPEAYKVQQYFAKMVEAGCDSVVMEVSSQALMQHRTQGFVFDIGIFTNLEPDHIGPNEHSDMEDYIRCKGLLFQQCKIGIVNADADYLEQVLAGHTCDVVTYAVEAKNADLKASEITLSSEGGALSVSFQVNGILNTQIQIPTPGLFSVYNALTAMAVCKQFDIPEDVMEKALAVTTVRGRIEPVKVSDEFTLMIDYAHNAMALESLLSTLRQYNPGRLVCVFGCGGNRSKLRRFDMGEVSGRLADLTIITSDNPRFEEPEDIIADIKTGISKTSGEYIAITDRKEAIAYAIHNGKPGDIIVVAGKGHEDYQEIKGVKYHMDDRELVLDIVAGR